MIDSLRGPLLGPCLVFVASWILTGLLAALCRRFGWVSRPRSERWHRKPVALHGGVAFALPFLVAAGMVLSADNPSSTLGAFPSKSTPQAISLALAALFSASLLLLCGLWDDLRQISAATKLICQLGATSIFVYAGGVFPLTGLAVLDLLVTYLWFVGITNAVNMLDNMDGLSSGMAIISATAVVLLSIKGGAVPFPSSTLGLLFAASVLGFWLHNKWPARIFMGDSGSMFIGFMLAALTMPSPLNGYLGINIHGQYPLIQGMLVLMLPVTALALPIFDTTFVTLARLLSARKVHEGGCDHTSHRLVLSGFSDRRSVFLLHTLAGLGALVAVLVQRFPDQALPLFGIFALIVFCFGAYLSHVTVPADDAARHLPLSARFLAGILLRRNAAQVLLDTILIVTCFWGAYLLRFDFNLQPFLRQAVLQALPLVVASTLLGLRLAGAYGSTWRLSSVSDLPSYALGVFIGTTLTFAVSTIVSRFGEGYSRSAYITFGFLLFLAISLSRQSFQLLDTAIRRRAIAQKKLCLQPVVIYGAGKGGRILLEETLFNEALAGVCVLGFVDDDPNLPGHTVGSFPIKEKPRWRQELSQAPEIWISSKAISNEQAQTFARLWNPMATVRRQVFRLETVVE